MSIREILARWLAPDAFRTVERYHYLRRQLAQAAHWCGYEFPEIEAAVFWAMVSEVNHFRPLGTEAVAAVPSKPWIWSISDFREHLRTSRLTTREQIAREIWTRFSPSHSLTWDEEPNKAEYLRCADAIRDPRNAAAAREAKPTLDAADPRQTEPREDK